MLTYKSYKFKLSPSEEQNAMLHQHGGNLRFAWNKLVEFANEKYKTTKFFPIKIELRAKLKEIQKDNSFLKISHSQPIQNESDKLFETILLAFKPESIKERSKKIAKALQEVNEEKRNKKLKKAYNYRFPNFKKKVTNSDSIFYPQFFKIKKSRIFFPKIGWIDYKKHRKIEGKPKFLTITQDGKNWNVSITCEIEIKENPKVEIEKANIIGIDVGLKTFATFSDGTEIQNPRTLKRFLKKLRREQKKLSKKKIIEAKIEEKTIKKSSSNREKQISKVQKVHRKIKNIRKDFLYQTIHNMINKYDGFILETLDIQNMLKASGKAMNRSILDVSWFEFGRILEYKSLWNSKYFLKNDKYDPSTQKCNNCNSLQLLTLEDRMYVCPHCGHTCGRDINAAKNVRDEGINSLMELRDTKNTKNTKNTTSTVGIKACGSLSIGSELKQEKLRIQFSSQEEDCLTSQASAFRQG